MAQNVYTNGNCWASAGVIYLRGCLWQCCDNCKTKKTNSFSLQFSSFCCIFWNVFQIKYRQLRPDWGAKRHGLIAFDCIFICMGKRESFFNHFVVVDVVFVVVVVFVVLGCGIFHFVQYWAVRIFTLFVNILLCRTCLLYQLDSLSSLCEPLVFNAMFWLCTQAVLPLLLLCCIQPWGIVFAGSLNESISSATAPQIACIG